ncbi:fimbrial protein [Pectobacterium odoriferum]|uniref:fimbria/pilus outer membrane usher protein n=1 Tax=Pectobacterium odoriferum TaxID=78398 RepID=UPI0013743533|nr:fimbria/pilus outer membrane usher protein [Pectobacterium odoriferum]QHP78617.1 fimbrial protein [Pectobacterium odoriferum]GKW03750.1 fimbrial protein [Pectobacterium carotovorum subsp. carotovorum]
MSYYSCISQHRPWRCVLPLLLAVGCVGLARAAIDNTDHDHLTFDTDVLKERGIDPSIAKLFSHAPRFMPGESSVVLTVNGDHRGRIKVRFDEKGTLCADRAFQRQARLASPPDYAESIACFDLRRAWPQAEIRPEPGEGKLHLIVPTEALSSSDTDDGNWQHGGVAGMLNYSAQYMNSSGGMGSIDFSQVDTEAGLNAGDWIMRSRQTFTRFNNQNRISHQAAYAQRSFVGLKKVLQLGQIGLSNSLFGTGQVQGFQMFPESALTSGNGGAGLVEGVAETPSVVEVRQSGVLVYSTTIPAGPFRLQGFSLLNTRSDLVVTLTGSNGQTRQFTVPAATLLTRVPRVSPGLSFGAGRLEQQYGQSPLVGTIATGWQMTPFTSLNAGVLGSAPYRAGSVNLETQLFDPTSLSLQATLAQDVDRGNTGALASTILSHSLSERLSVNVTGSQQTSKYRELSDALQRDSLDNPNSQSRSRYQWGSGVSWSEEVLGSFSLSWARSTTFAGNNTDYLRGSWSRQFERAYLSVSLERNTATINGRADDRLYVSFSMPLGEGRDINSYLNTSKRNTRTGVRYSERTSQDRGWSIATDRDLRNNRTSASGNVDFVTPVSQLSASLSHDSDNYTNWSARASGGAVFHEGGATLSPYRVAETFGIARVGKESGVRLDTPGGPVWTNRWGYAVLPTLNGYRRSGVQIDTRSLAKNVDVSNAWQDAEMARGAIGRVDFDVIRTRRVLVETMMADGKRIQPGASVFDDSGNLITVVGDDGSVFVPDAAPGMLLEVQSSGRTVCSMKLDLPEAVESLGFYENAAATCR